MTKKADAETTRGYKFTYSHLNRMTNAGYDRNGNILGLKRSGKNSSSAYGMMSKKRND
ncbi:MULTISPECIES: hypothetical protein [Bacteroides]|uniref:Uncharacterized protein n=1 Tax=Bacteroides intestinalis TaxID=329854 RepID=A0A6N2W8K3_9BACE|nr:MULTISPECIES: hypothetical protein [Bacteroides]